MTGYSHMRVSHKDACRLAALVISDFGGMPSIRNVGLFFDRRGNPRRIGVKGEADVQGVMPDGRAVAVEVKTGKATRTAQQRRWGKRFAELGGLYLVARWSETEDGAEQIRAALRDAGYADRP